MVDTLPRPAPLTHAEKKEAAPIAKPKEEWVPILPVPDHVTTPEIQHSKLGRPGNVYTYRDADNGILGYICRFDTGPGEKEVLPFICCRSGDGKRFAWRWQSWAKSKRPLYGLDSLYTYPAAIVIVTEGEKDCDAARKLFPVPDYVVITSPGGSCAAKYTDWAALKGRKVCVWPDADEPGAKYADAVQKIALQAGARAVGIMPILRGKKTGWGADDAYYSDSWGAQEATQYFQQAKYKNCKSKLPRGFDLQPNGLFYDPDPEKDAPMIRICDHLEVLAYTRDEYGENWGRVLQFKDPDGKQKQWAMPNRLLKGNGEPMREKLFDLGLRIEPGHKARNSLQSYIQSVEPALTATSTDKTGWHQNRFVMPDTIIPATDELLLQSEYVNSHHAFNSQGTLQDWHDNVGRYFAGNSRLILGACTAFAAPLLRFDATDSAIFHLRGSSSLGKSTALWAAASIWGGGDGNGYIQQWRSTDNALEATARLHNDCLLCLDEMGQVDGRVVGEVAYMLANEAGKSRMSKGIELRPRKTWKLLGLSTGEVSLADKMREAGKKPHAGMETRLIDVPADAGRKHGLFEMLHGFQNGEEFSRYLKKVSNQYYGTAIREYLHFLAQYDKDELQREIQDAVKEAIGLFSPADASGQVKRVAGRFGLLLAAGRMAIRCNAFVCDEGDLLAGLQRCFSDWLENRHTIGDLEVLKGIEQVRSFFQRNLTSRFHHMRSTDYTSDDEYAVSDQEKVFDSVGFRRKNQDGLWEFFVYPDALNNEILKDFSPKIIKPVLLEQGLLCLGDAQNPLKPKVQHLPKPHPKRRMYHFAPLVLGDSDEE